MQIAGVDIYSVRGQVIVMLLQILQLQGASTRRGTADSIADRGWFDFQGEDLRPYPLQTTREPRWRTLIAWARQDAIDSELLSRVGFDNWQLSPLGRQQADSLKLKFASRELDARRCYMWRSNFKKFMCSSYEPSPLDSERPPNIYEDHVPYDPRREALWLLGEIQRREGRGSAEAKDGGK